MVAVRFQQFTKKSANDYFLRFYTQHMKNIKLCTFRSFFGFIFCEGGG